MSEKKVDPKIAARRLLVRGGLVVAYVFLVGLFFVTGKGHTVLVDNKDAADGSAVGINGALVSIDGREALEQYPGDRDIVLLKGQRHRVRIQLPSGEPPIEMSLALPLNTDMLLLSIPKLVAKQAGYLEEFVQRDQPRPADEKVGDNNAFTSPDAPVTTPAP